jgi:DNA-directed RNA polymerase specialized sigma24 family protein
MRHFDELSSQETAAVLGITHPAAMKRYTRAMLRLRKLWTATEPTGQE